MPKPLKTVLKELHTKISPDKFRLTVCTVFAEMRGEWTDEELLFHPVEAQSYCEQVRRALRSDVLPDELILRTLINSRKHPVE